MKTQINDIKHLPICYKYMKKIIYCPKCNNKIIFGIEHIMKNHVICHNCNYYLLLDKPAYTYKDY